jgi:hypothetical protein
VGGRPDDVRGCPDGNFHPKTSVMTTLMKAAISVETRIAVTLCRLGTSNGLLLVGEVFGIFECTPSCIVWKFCKVVRKHLLRVLVQFPKELQFKVLASQFEALHGVPYIVGTIDSSHIPVLAPVIGGKIIIIGNHSIQQFYRELLM